jgi:hypothetical protein
MIGHRIRACAAALLLTLSLAAPVHAAAPSNDDIASPVAITLPSTTTQSTVEATPGATDPNRCSASGHSVWFAYTAAADGRAQATTFGSDFDTVLYVGTDDGAGGVELIACNDDGFDLQSVVRFDAVAGRTYLLMVGSFGGSPGGNLVLNLNLAPPPLVVEVTVDDGTFAPRGEATITGTIRCSGGARVQVDLLLSQPSAG